MSKSMWIDAIDSKPVIGDEKIERDYSISPFVWIWEEDDHLPVLARYYHNSKRWCINNEMIVDGSKIKYFAYIDNPYK